MNENKQTATGSNKLSLGLKILGLILIIAAFAYLLFQNKSKSDSIRIQKKEMVLKDSLINDYKLKQQKIDLLSELVKSYLKVRTAHNAEALNEYYADTLEHYYKYLSNSSKEKVMAAEKKYWTSFKVDSFLVKSEPEITIDSTQIQAIVKGLQCVNPNDCIEEIMVLQFNPSFKIISVKAYFMK
jgi:hypothetical protein